jgi:hypothetical protein
LDLKLTWGREGNINVGCREKRGCRGVYEWKEASFEGGVRERQECRGVDREGGGSFSREMQNSRGVTIEGERPVSREEVRERGKDAGVLTEGEGYHSQERCKTALS